MVSIDNEALKRPVDRPWRDPKTNRLTGCAMSSHNSLQFASRQRGGNHWSWSGAANTADVAVRENGMGGGSTATTTSAKNE
jgi:hypothetical protein